jgi:hypothetical protein
MDDLKQTRDLIAKATGKPPPTDAEREAFVRMRGLTVTAERCYECDAELTKTVCRVRIRGNWIVPVCPACARKADHPYGYGWHSDSGRCEGCGRKVIEPSRWTWGGRRIVACSERCRERARRLRPQPAARKCDSCGKSFKPSRVDARYCSSACRQKAYRRRLPA